MRRIVPAVAIALAAGLFSLQARADVATNDRFALDVGLGYSKLNIDGDFVSELDDSDSAAVSVRFTFLNPHRSNWRIGFSLHAAGTWEETDPFILDGEVFDDDPYKEFSMLVPMFRVGYHFPIGDSGWFVEPSFGVGPSFGYFRAGEDRGGNWWDDDDEFEERWEVGIAIQPALQVGYAWDHFAAGGEVGYLWTHLDFDDDIGGDVTELYLGGFFRWSF
jgi:hypothetical protein